MTVFNKSLASFWKSFGLEAYLSGNVPDTARFPYITFECVACPPFGTTIITANAWFRVAPGYDLNEDRTALADAIRDAIVPEGIRLPADDGFVLLYPDTMFLSYNDTSDEDGVKGLRIACQAHFIA